MEWSRPVVLLDNFEKDEHTKTLQRLRGVVVTVEPHIPTSESEIESADALTEASLTCIERSGKTIQQAFYESQSQWIDDPIISQWRDPNHRVHQVLSEVHDLYHAWSSAQTKPFSPSANVFSLQIGRLLADVGLPWHNNQINMPNEIDTSWPFHFKSYEMRILRAKGARVGDPDASGYVSNVSEANCYCIRALQQELREKHPTRRPILVYDHFDPKILKSVEAFFGLELHQISLSNGRDDLIHDLKNVTADGTRPIIFTATLGNANGEHDDMEMICEISHALPLFLHVDATRSFDYITTLPKRDRRQLGIQEFTLGMKSLDQSLRSRDGSIIAGTIVAGGFNCDASAPAVALKPASLGANHERVAYTRASDSTLAGSRDAVSILWLALQELQLGEAGYQEVYQHCASMRTELLRRLQSSGVSTGAPRYSFDVIIRNCSREQKEHLVKLGGSLTGKGEVVLTVQPQAKLEDVESVISIMSPTTQHYSAMDLEQDLTSYPIPENIVNELRATVQSWKVATRSAAGYPFHMGSLSALGPIIGRFLDLLIPDDWVKARSGEILTARMETFGLHTARDRSMFQGAFTNGSTMGNRVGIHVALRHFPDAFVYFSSESHYSVIKTMRDCDALTNRWIDRGPRYSQIPSDANGSILVETLVQQALLDKMQCLRRGEAYHMILFANMGTTFVGARDDLARIRASLNAAGIEISYIHVDGALDFGFDNCGIALGPPGSTGPDELPRVQGITLSHHKAMGNMVSGEVLCYSLGGELASLVSPIDPRVVFETWLYSQIYTSSDLGTMLQYCRANASRLVSGLKRLGVATKRNGQELIVVLERPPAWIIEEFSLRPQGDWVHFITMPHISPETVDFFVERIASVERQCEIAFSYVKPLLSPGFMRPVKLRRVQCGSPLGEKAAKLTQSLQPLNSAYDTCPNTTVNACIRGALSVAVIDEDEQLQAVFLAESLRDMSIRVGPILMASTYRDCTWATMDIGAQLIGFMARHMQAMVRTDEASYAMCLF
ncbi:hypothetical protein DL767_008349 [Monosporascus sp. MG133]|nr:hypothetical protein DL767_008349 [Monosporascus sp. MG133]